MTDILREIDEELERERVLALWTKYRTPIITVVAALLLGVASYSAWLHHNEANVITQTLALDGIAARENQDDKAKAEALSAFAKQFEQGGAAKLAHFSAARSYIDAGDREKAVAELKVIADDKNTEQVLRDYAKLLITSFTMDAKPEEALAEVTVLADSKDSPWRYNAQALKGLIVANKGDYATAAQIFGAIENKDDAALALKEQARDLGNYYAMKAEPESE